MSKSELSDSKAHRVPPYKRPIIIGGFLLIIVIVSLITFLVFRAVNKSKTEGQQPPKTPDSNLAVDRPTDTPNQTSPEEPLENKAPQYEGEDPNLLDELTGVIIYADIDQEEQILHSAVQINQYLSENGQCVLNLKRNDIIMRTASAVATPDVTTSTCGPISVSVDSLDPGEYVLEIIMTGDDKQGTITDKITI